MHVKSAYQLVCYTKITCALYAEVYHDAVESSNITTLKCMVL